MFHYYSGLDVSSPTVMRGRACRRCALPRPACHGGIIPPCRHAGVPDGKEGAYHVGVPSSASLCHLILRPLISQRQRPASTGEDQRGGRLVFDDFKGRKELSFTLWLSSFSSHPSFLPELFFHLHLHLAISLHPACRCPSANCVSQVLTVSPSAVQILFFSSLQALLLSLPRHALSQSHLFITSSR